MASAIPIAWKENAARVRHFIETEVILHEQADSNHEDLPPALVHALQNKAREYGLWGPQLSKDLGGMGLTLPELCLVFEEAGRSLLGPIALHCAAPDEGNMHRFVRPRQSYRKSISVRWREGKSGPVSR